MKIYNLFMRFMKDCGVYGGEASKDSLSYMKEYNDAMIPFNAFRWDTTEQGHKFWYGLSIDWIIILYNHRHDIDEEDNKHFRLSDETFIIEMECLLFDLCPFELPNESSKELKVADEVYESHTKLSDLYYSLKQDN